MYYSFLKTWWRSCILPHQSKFWMCYILRNIPFMHLLISSGCMAFTPFTVLFRDSAITLLTSGGTLGQPFEGPFGSPPAKCALRCVIPPEEDMKPQYLQTALCRFASTGVACSQAASSGLPLLTDFFDVCAANLKEKEENVQTTAFRNKS